MFCPAELAGDPPHTVQFNAEVIITQLNVFFDVTWRYCESFASASMSQIASTKHCPYLPLPAGSREQYSRYSGFSSLRLILDSLDTCFSVRPSLRFCLQ